MASSTIRKLITNFVDNSNPRIVDFKKNEMILRQNEDNRDIGFVLDGIVYLCAENQDYERNILCILRQGDCFSRFMLLPSDHAPSYLIAKCQTRIVFFQREELEQWQDKHSSQTENFISSVNEQLQRDILTQTYILHQKTLRKKLICYFKNESDYQNSRNLTLPVPYSDLADYLAVDRSAMMKEIAKMKRDNLIAGQNRTLFLLAPLFHEEP